VDCEEFSEDELRRAIARIAERDLDGCVPVYQCLLGNAKKIVPDRLSSDLAHEALLDVIRGAHSFCAERGDPQAWLYSLTSNTWARLSKKGKLGPRSGEISLDAPVSPSSQQAVIEMVEDERTTRYEDALLGDARVVYDAREQGFLTDSESKALWLFVSEDLTEGIAEYVFGDPGRSAAAAKRCLTVLLRLEVFLARRAMTPSDVVQQTLRAHQQQLLSKEQSRMLLEYLKADSSARASEVRDTSWGIRPQLRSALFGFAASLHLCRSPIEAAVKQVEEDPVLARWCVASNWPQPYGRLLKKLPARVLRSAPADFWEQLGLRTSLGPGATPRFHTISVSDTRRLAYDLRVVSRGIAWARANFGDATLSEAIVRSLQGFPDAAALSNALGGSDGLAFGRRVCKRVLSAAHLGEAAPVALQVACYGMPGLGESLRVLAEGVK
jgi:hypothetical protein